MKKFTLAMAVVVAGTIGLAACKKAATPPVPSGAAAPTAPAGGEAKATPEVTAPTAPGTTAVGSIPADEIANLLSKAVCGRMMACEKDKPEGHPPVNETDCASMMSKDLAQALPEKAKTISRDQLTGCVAAITKASCDELNAPTAPKGCEFMD